MCVLCPSREDQVTLLPYPQVPCSSPESHWVNICRIRLPRASLSRLREGASITVRTEEFRGSYVGWGSADRRYWLSRIAQESLGFCLARPRADRIGDADLPPAETQSPYRFPAAAHFGIQEHPSPATSEFWIVGNNQSSFSRSFADASPPARSRDPNIPAGWSPPVFPQTDSATDFGARSGLLGFTTL